MTVKHVNAMGKVNILLVDDQQAKLLSHEVVLAGLGETLIKASSAREAFECLLKNDIALILIDVCMPELDGFELAAMIREHPRFQRIAIIFVSAIMTAHLDQLRGYELGAVDFVPVPVVPELLRAKVKVFVDLFRKTRELEQLNAELEQRVFNRTAELQRLNEELERRIEERTRERETALAQLFEAQKMDTIGRLTGGVAHDFNNLLMVILTSLSLLNKRLAQDPHCQMLVQNAVQGAQRGAALTQRLLAFSRRQELKPVSVELAGLVMNMEDLLKRALGLGIDLVYEIPDNLWPVLADANQLELALLNVAVNARDAMPAGGRLLISAAQVTISERQPKLALKLGDYVRILVTDTGTGMDEATLAKAAEPFFTTKGVGKGTGLGLSTVQGLAAQSGGLLRISSELNVGTTIELWLPRAEPIELLEHRSEERSELSYEAAAQNILIVDDDPLVLVGMEAMIQDLGHTAIVRQSGREVLEALSSGLAVDIVITDYTMPVMSGLELAQTVHQQYPHIPIVLATGYADAPTDVEPITARLSKPCTQEDIAGAIHAAINSRSFTAGQPKATELTPAPT